MAEIWVKVEDFSINLVVHMPKTRVFRVFTHYATIYLRLHLAISFIRADGPKKFSSDEISQVENLLIHHHQHFQEKILILSVYFYIFFFSFFQESFRKRTKNDALITPFGPTIKQSPDLSRSHQRSGDRGTGLEDRETNRIQQK